MKSRAVCMIGGEASFAGPLFSGNGPVRIKGCVSHFVYKRTTKGNFEKLHKFNEFSHLSAKSCLSRT